jgi:DNA-binding NarL/FixJ family response regulator
MDGQHVETKQPIVALIAAKPGRLRNSLLALLQTVTRIEQIIQVSDSTMIPKLVTWSSPALLLLDTELVDNNLANILKQIKTIAPHLHCIVLAHTYHQQEAAQTAGADSVLLAGFSTENLFAAVEGVLGRMESRTP